MIEQLKKPDGFILACLDDNFNWQKEWQKLDDCSLRCVDSGVIQVKPDADSFEGVVISCGIHGNETAPIEIVSQLISKIIKGELKPKVNLLFILGNPASMKINQRFVALNMNRLFAGAHTNYTKDAENTYELERAENLEKCVKVFYEKQSLSSRLHLDLHTAIRPSFHKTFAIRPHTDHLFLPGSKFLLRCLGIEAVLQHNKPSTTFSYYSVSQLNAEAYTLELGKVKPFGENDPDDFSLAINCLEALVEQKNLLEVELPDSKPLKNYEVVGEIIKQSENFILHLGKDVENFTPFPPDFVIAEDSDYVYRVGETEESVVFPNPDVPVGQRVAVMVKTV